MQTKPTSALKFALCLLIASVITAKAEIGSNTHNIANLHHFGSVQEITNYFQKVKVPIEVLELKNFSKEHFLFAAFPYSGLDTIDVYCYVKYGEQWDIKMLYFHLRPKARSLTVEETADQIVVFCAKEEFIRLSPDKKLNSVDR